MVGRTLNSITNLATIGLIVGGAYYLHKTGVLKGVSGLFNDLKSTLTTEQTHGIKGAHTLKTGETFAWNIHEPTYSPYVETKLKEVGKDLTMEQAVHLARANTLEARDQYERVQKEVEQIKKITLHTPGSLQWTRAVMGI